MACAHVQPATVKAHAPVLAIRFPTSGFGRRSERHIGAMRGQPNIAPGRREGAIMRLLAVLAAVAMAGCSGVSGKEQSLAQCRLDADGSSGTKFQRDYVGNNSRSEPREDQAYSAFLITCMEAKGYKFAAPFDGAGALNKKCWIRNANGSLQSMPWAGGPSCFSR